MYAALDCEKFSGLSDTKSHCICCLGSQSPCICCLGSQSPCICCLGSQSPSSDNAVLKRGMSVSVSMYKEIITCYID